MQKDIDTKSASVRTSYFPAVSYRPARLHEDAACRSKQDRNAANTVLKCMLGLVLFAIALFLLFGCGRQTRPEVVLPPSPLDLPQQGSASQVPSASSSATSLDQVVLLEQAMQFFVDREYYPFMPMEDEAGYKSFDASGNVIYLYSEDGGYLDRMTYRYFVQNDTFTENDLTSGINRIADVISLFLQRELTVEERQQLKERYRSMIGEQKMQQAVRMTFDRVTFDLDVEPLSKTLLCSYSVPIR